MHAHAHTNTYTHARARAPANYSYYVAERRSRTTRRPSRLRFPSQISSFPTRPAALTSDLCLGGKMYFPMPVETILVLLQICWVNKLLLIHRLCSTDAILDPSHTCSIREKRFTPTSTNEGDLLACVIFFTLSLKWINELIDVTDTCQSEPTQPVHPWEPSVIFHRSGINSVNDSWTRP